MSLQNLKVRRVALIIESNRSYGKNILHGISDYIQENHPWQIYTAPRSLYDPIPDWLFHWDGDGIIIRSQDSEGINALRKTGIPLVDLKEMPNKSHNADIITDWYAVGRSAAEYFISRNFQHYAFIGMGEFSWSKKQSLGFSETLKNAGMSCVEYSCQRFSVDSADSWDREIDALSEWLQKQPTPMAILTADDYIGMKVSSACRLAQLRVPYQVAILGVGNEESICKLISPTLSSICVNEVTLGRQAAVMLECKMTGGITSNETIFIPPGKVVSRHSTDATAVDDPLVAAALVYIRDNFANGINATDVVNQLDVSRSVLQRRFVKTLGRTLYDVILDWKIQAVKELLTDTNLTMRKIAKLTGFKHVEHLNNLFKKKVGIPLMAYRRNS